MVIARYAAKVCAFTAAIIVFGDANLQDDESFSVTTYTLSRMAQTFIGVCIYILCATLIFPQNARDQAVVVLNGVLAGLKEQHESIFKARELQTYGSEPEKKRKQQVTKILAKRATQRDAIRKQLVAHESLTFYAQEEFSCKRADFYPEYTVAM